MKSDYCFEFVVFASIVLQKLSKSGHREVFVYSVSIVGNDLGAHCQG